MFREEETDLTIEKVSYNCDNEFEGVHDILPQSTFFWVLCGRPKSGKTSLMLNLLTKRKMYRKQFTTIIYVSPSMNSVKSLKSTYIPMVYHYDSLLDNTDMITELINATNDNDANTLLILDDVQNELKNKEILKWLGGISANRRHIRCSTLLLVQNYITIPPQVRKLITNLVIFQTRSTSELDKIRSEYNLLPAKMFEDFVAQFFSGNVHDFLMFDFERQRTFVGRNEHGKTHFYEIML